MQERLDVARQELRATQDVEGLRDEMTEAALARRIAVLENEVENPTY